MGKFAFLTLFLTIMAHCATSKSRVMLSSIDIESWKKDTCGIHNKRSDISINILSHKKLLIGMKMEEIEKIFGVADFRKEYDMIKYRNSIQLEYSTSSAEILNTKCGDPITRSLAFIIDKNSKKVLDIKEFVY